MVDDPVVEQFRLKTFGSSYSGVITLAYPSKSLCVAMGLVGTDITPSMLKSLMKHVKSKNRSKLVFYIYQGDTEIKREYEL